MNKICSNPNCKSEGRPLPLSMFYKNPSTKDGLDGQCRWCRQKYGEHKRSADTREINETFWKDQNCADGVGL